MDSSLNMNTLASSLPTSNLANAEAELMDNFKAAALSITTLYRSSLNTSKQAYNAGYAAACTDLLSVIQQGVSLGGAGEEGGEGGMTIGRVMDWVEARLEAIRTREEEEDEEREGGGGAKNKTRGGAAVRRDKRDTTPPTPSTSHAQQRASSPSTQRRQSPSTPSAPAPAPTTTPTTTTPHPAPSTVDAARPPAPVSQATLTPPTHPRPLLRSKTRSQKELNHHLIHTATVDPFTFTAPGPTAPLFADVFPSHALSTTTIAPGGGHGGSGKLGEGGNGGSAGSVTIGAKRRHAAMLDSSPVSSADGTPTRGDAYTVFSPSGLGLGNGNGGSSRKRTKSGRGMGGSAHHTSNANNANNNPSGYGNGNGNGNGTTTMVNATSGYNVNVSPNDTSTTSLNVLQPNNGNALAGDAMDVEDEGSGRERKRVSRR